MASDVSVVWLETAGPVLSELLFPRSVIGVISVDGECERGRLGSETLATDDSESGCRIVVSGTGYGTMPPSPGDRLALDVCRDMTSRESRLNMRRRSRRPEGAKRKNASTAVTTSDPICPSETLYQFAGCTDDDSRNGTLVKFRVAGRAAFRSLASRTQIVSLLGGLHIND